MRDRYYFAYGSNMNPWRLTSRVPGARFVGVGYVRGWRVAERLYADIDRRGGEVTWGVVYAVSNAGLAKLDRFEGCPRIYRRRAIAVHMGGRIVHCATYAMTRRAKRNRDGLHYPEAYRRICSFGARYFGILDAFGKEVAA